MNLKLKEFTTSKIQSSNPALFIFVIVVLTFLASAIAYLIVSFISLFDLNFSNWETPKVSSSHGFSTLITVCLIAPLFETLITQFLPIEIFKGRVNEAICVLLSALCFSILHFYGIAYMINTFFIGIVFAIGYILWNKPNTIHAFWIICIVHSLRNLISFLITF
jgi:hypothetical protein